MSGKSAQATRESPESSLGQGQHSTRTANVLDPRIDASETTDARTGYTDGGSGATTGPSDLSGTAGTSSLVDRTKNIGDSGDSHFQGGQGTGGVTGK